MLRSYKDRHIQPEQSVNVVNLIALVQREVVHPPHLNNVEALEEPKEIHELCRPLLVLYLWLTVPQNLVGPRQSIVYT